MSGVEQAIRMGKWKAVRHGLNQPIELYDLETDISEQRDLATLSQGCSKN